MIPHLRRRRGRLVLWGARRDDWLLAIVTGEAWDAGATPAGARFFAIADFARLTVSIVVPLNPDQEST